VGIIATEIVRLARQEWGTFGLSTRSIANEWHIVGNEADEPYLSHISRYWAAVGQPGWNGATPEAWSAAFISWCFKEAGAGENFRRSGNHSRYIARIRQHDGMSPRLRLRPPTRAVEPGDLIWNARGDGQPAGYEEAVQRLEAGESFDSHVDIVVAVSPGSCESIGGNVYPPPPPEGGSVVQSTWRLDESGALADDRKNWLGVIKNGL
jgi:hypothetical protein